MAHLYERDGSWYLQFFDRSRRPPRKTIAIGRMTARKAVEKKARIEYDLESGRFDPWDATPDSSSKPTIAEALVGFFAHISSLRDTTQHTYRVMLRDLEKEVGHREIESITTQDVVHLTHGRAAATRRKKARHLKVFFNWAIAQGWIASNPVSGISLPRLPRRTNRALSDSDLQTLLSYIEQHAQNSWLLTTVYATARMGLRRGEVLGLRWGDVDPAARTVRVAGKGESDRTLPIPDDVFERLGPPGPPDAPVFTASGHPLYPNYVTRTFSRYAKLALGRLVRFHDLRHTALTRLIRVGVPTEIVRRIAGHSSLAVTQQYLHARDEDLATALERAAPS